MTETKTIYGQITDKSEVSGIGKTGRPYIKWLYTIEDKKYSTFDRKIADAFYPLNDVKVLLEQNGEYWNMINMELATPEEMVNNPEPVKPGVAQPINPLQDEKTRNINRCVAMKGAIDLCCAGRIELKDGSLELIANRIFNYLNL